MLAVPLAYLGRWGPELSLVSGAFLVGYLRRFGLTGTGLGSQIYIGQLLAYTAELSLADLPTILIAGVVASLAAVVPRVLSGPAERPPPFARTIAISSAVEAELAMGFQAAAVALIVVLANAAIGLIELAWAITASTYVIAGSPVSTLDRVWRRIVGTVVGVSLGLCCLPLTTNWPLIIWAFAALAMVIYALALPERYDIACAGYAFTLVVTLAISGVHSVPLLASRAWETVLGGTLGLAAATLLLPIHIPKRS